MFIGAFLALVLFAPLGFLITRVGVHTAYNSGNRWMALPSVFLGLLFGLSLLSFCLVGVGSLFGVSIAVAGDVLASNADLVEPGYISGLGLLAVVTLAAVGAMAGPAAAFVAAKVATILTFVFVLVKIDEDKAKLYLPMAGAAIGGFCMWPFTTMLTFGL